jgi:hypothetical protein
MLTGSAADVKKTLDAWGMWAKPAENGQLDHPSRVFLVDKQGRDIPPGVEDMELLLRE